MSRWKRRQMHEAIEDCTYDLLFEESREDKRLQRLELRELDQGPRGVPAQGPAAPLGAGLGAAPTPCGITGEKRIGIGCLRFSLPFAALELVRSRFASWFGPSEQWDGGMHGFSRTQRFEFGAMIQWKPAEELGGLPQFLAVVDQSALDGCSFSELSEICAFFVSIEDVRCTRVDHFVDVPRDVLSVDQVVRAAMKDHFAGFNVVKWIGGRKKGVGANNNGVEFGRRGKNGSGRFLRIYDKFLESGGKYDATRIEAEWSKSNSVSVCMFRRMCDVMKQGEAAFVDFVVGQVTANTVDFLRRDDRRSARARSVRYKWWKAVRVAAKSAVVRPVYVKRKVVEQVERAVERAGKALATVAAIAERSGADGLAVVLEGVRALIRAGDSCAARMLADKFVDSGGSLARAAPAFAIEEIPF